MPDFGIGEALAALGGSDLLAGLGNQTVYFFFSPTPALSRRRKY